MTSCYGNGLLALSLLAPAAAAQAKPGSGLVGTTAEAMSLAGLDGQTVGFPDRSPGSRLNVIVFWATWNRFSERELAELTARWPKWSGSGVRVVAVNVESHRIGTAERSRVRKWLQEHPVPFPVAMDARLRAFRAYGVVAVPTTLVVAEGKVVFRVPGYPIGGAERLNRFIEQRLQAHKAEREQAPLVRHSAAYRRAVRHLHLARVLVTKHEAALAIYTLKKAIDEDPSLLEAHIELSRRYDEAGKPDLAQKVLAAARVSFPMDARLLLRRAEHAFLIGQSAAATDLARAAIKRNPALAAGYTLAGKIAAKHGDGEGARQALEEAMRINPFALDSILEMARLLETANDKKKALELYEQAYDLLLGPASRSNHDK